MELGAELMSNATRGKFPKYLIVKNGFKLIYTCLILNLHNLYITRENTDYRR